MGQIEVFIWNYKAVCRLLVLDKISFLIKLLIVNKWFNCVQTNYYYLIELLVFEYKIWNYLELLDY